MAATAKVIKRGASQTVRLPKGFSFDVDEVKVKRIGTAVVLYPAGAGWDQMAKAMGQADEDFVTDRQQPLQSDRRRALDTRRRW